MPSDYLNTQILLYEDDFQKSSGTTISGKIIYSPKIDLSVEELGYQLIIIAKNKYRTNEIPVSKEIFFRNKILKKGKDYSYDFEFTPLLSSSFHSKNLTLEPYIESIVKLQTSDYLKIRKDYLEKKRLTTLVDTNEILWSKKQFSQENIERNLVIEEQNYHASNEYKKPWIYFIISSFISTVIISSFNLANGNQILALILTSLFLIFIAPQLYKRHILNSLGIDTKQLGENQFGIFLDLTKNWKRIQSVKAEYGIFSSLIFSDAHEEVPYGVDLYISPPIEKSKIKIEKADILDFPEVKYDFIFDFPKNNFPSTFENDSISFYWEFKITVYFFLGLKSEFVKEIKVKQVPTT